MNKSVFADPRAMADLRKERKRKKTVEGTGKTFVLKVVKEKIQRKGMKRMATHVELSLQLIV